MTVMAHMGGIKPVADVLVVRLRETIESLGLKMDDGVIIRLCIDFIEKFNYETLPDLLMCLESGRKNMHPKVKVYGTLTMEVLSGWMRYQLEEKYSERENRHRQHKRDNRPHEEQVVFKSRADYLEWAEKGLQQQKEIDEANGKTRKEKHSKTLDRLSKVAVSIGKPSSKKK